MYMIVYMCLYIKNHLAYTNFHFIKVLLLPIALMFIVYL